MSPPHGGLILASCPVTVTLSPLCSVGNKNDDPNSKVVETTDAQKFAEQMGINLFETSAKENINVEEVTPCLWQRAGAPAVP